MNLSVKLSALLAAFAVVAAPTAQAGVLIEPYVGYYMGKSTQPGSEDTDIKGIGFGGRLGYKFLGLMGGIDYMTGMYDADSTPKVDATPTDLGVFVGYEFPIMLRAYLVYNFQNKLEMDSTTKVELEGKGGLKFGVGFTALPLVAINLEYMTAEFDEANGIDQTGNELETKFYGLNISIPFEF